jgi:hypothetical protein
MGFRWPQIRFTLLEFVLAPESPVDGQTDAYLGGCTGGSYDLAQDSPEPEEEDCFGFGGSR